MTTAWCREEGKTSVWPGVKMAPWRLGRTVADGGGVEGGVKRAV